MQTIYLKISSARHKIADMEGRGERYMEKVKKVLDRIFIEGLSAMAHGLFATLIIGTIIQQIGTFMGGNIGEMIFIAGKLAATLTGAGIGVAVAYKFKEAPLVVVSAATAGMAGALQAVYWPEKYS